MMTEVPAIPPEGANPETVGCTPKLVELVPVPDGVVTLIVPVVAPFGTVAVICKSELTVYAADVPLNFTELAPVKLVPVRTTGFPTISAVGAKLTTCGRTVKFDALVPLPLGVVTVIKPVVELAGTVTFICVGETTV